MGGGNQKMRASLSGCERRNDPGVNSATAQPTQTVADDPSAIVSTASRAVNIGQTASGRPILRLPSSDVKEFTTENTKPRRGKRVTFMLMQQRSAASSQDLERRAEARQARRHQVQKGRPKVDAVVMRQVVGLLFQKVFCDEALGPFYQGMPVERLLDKQQALLDMVFGWGTELMHLDCPMLDMRSLHMALLVDGGLTLHHWQRFLTHFQATLGEVQGIPGEAKARALQWMQSTKGAFREPEPDEIEDYRRQVAAQGARVECPF